MILDALLLLLFLVAWGAQVTVPLRLAAAAPATTLEGDGDAERTAAPTASRRRLLWSLASFPLALAGVVAGLALADRNPDAAIAARLTPLLASTPGRLLAVLAPALVAGAIIAGVAGVARIAALAGRAGGRLDGTGYRLAAALGLAACAAAAWAGELLRAGEGPPCSPARLALLAGCRLALALAGGELLTPGRPRWAMAGGAALLAYLPLLPPEVRHVLWSQRYQLTCGAAALLLLPARWLPRALRPLALAAGLLLGAVALAQAGRASQALAPGIDVEEFPVLR
jgi:hypothetical protein